MVSGNPVLSCRIGGIPDEYFEHLIEIKSISAEDIRSAILSVAQMTCEEREEKGRASRKFIISKKSNVAQTGEMLKFIEN